MRFRQFLAVKLGIPSLHHRFPVLYPCGKDELVKHIPLQLSSKQWWGEVSYQTDCSNIISDPSWPKNTTTATIEPKLAMTLDGPSRHLPYYVLLPIVPVAQYHTFGGDYRTQLIIHAQFGSVTMEDREEATLRAKEIPIWVSGLWEVVRKLHLQSVVEAIAYCG